PSVDRAKHLADVKIPMLFLQGSRDEFAELDLLKATVKSLGKRASLHLEDAADHSFHVPAKSGRKDADVLTAILDKTRDWMLRRGATSRGLGFCSDHWRRLSVCGLGNT